MSSMGLVAAIAAAARGLGRPLLQATWDGPEVAKLDEEVRAVLTTWRGACPPGGCLVPHSPSEPYRPMGPVALRFAIASPERSAGEFFAWLKATTPQTTTDTATIRTYADGFRRSLLDGSPLDTIPDLDQVDRRITAAAVWELVHVHEESAGALLAYLARHQELLSPWRWFAAHAQFRFATAPVADWTTPAAESRTWGPTGVRSLALRPVVDLRAHMDLVVARSTEIPHRAGAHRGNDGLGSTRRLVRPAAAPAVEEAPWRHPAQGRLDPHDFRALQAFAASMRAFSPATTRNYQRVVYDLLCASGGLRRTEMEHFLGWVSMPPQRRPLARTAWSAFAPFAESQLSPRSEVRLMLPRFLSSDLARRAGVDLERPWPEGGPREHLRGIVEALGTRAVHRLRARHLQFEGAEVVAIANPLRRVVAFEPLNLATRAALTAWVRWATSGQGTAEWAALHPEWRVPVLHPEYPVVASEGLLRVLTR